MSTQLFQTLIDNKLNELNAAEQAKENERNARIASVDLMLRMLWTQLEPVLKQYERPSYIIGNHEGVAPAAPIAECGNKYHPNNPVSSIRFEDYSEIYVSDVTLSTYGFKLYSKYESESQTYKNLSAEEVLKHVADLVATHVKNDRWKRV